MERSDLYWEMQVFCVNESLIGTDSERRQEKCELGEEGALCLSVGRVSERSSSWIGRW